MGLFYTVNVKVPLEGLTDQERDKTWWQTKDFDGWGTVEITPEGRLFEYDYETTPEDERPDCKGKPPEERTALDKFRGAIRKVSLKPENDTNYHGDLNFYGTKDGLGKGEWFEYVARFTDGQLTGIVRIKEAPQEDADVP